ncbi:MAG: hypothetical protein ACRDS0_16095 [Pseudonocardiaceae bacterium]
MERSTIARWEGGETAPQPWFRPRIAQALQLSLEQLDELLAEGGVTDPGMYDRLDFTLPDPTSVDSRYHRPVAAPSAAA